MSAQAQSALLEVEKALQQQREEEASPRRRGRRARPAQRSGREEDGARREDGAGADADVDLLGSALLRDTAEVESPAVVREVGDSTRSAGRGGVQDAPVVAPGPCGAFGDDSDSHGAGADFRTGSGDGGVADAAWGDADGGADWGGPAASPDNDANVPRAGRAGLAAKVQSTAVPQFDNSRFRRVNETSASAAPPPAVFKASTYDAPEARPSDLLFQLHREDAEIDEAFQYEVPRSQTDMELRADRCGDGDDDGDGDEMDGLLDEDDDHLMDAILDEVL